MKRLPSQSGFTLVEIMVAVAIFSIVVTVGIGSLLSVNNTLKRTRAQRTAIDSMNFVFESMSRRIRTGSEISCTGTPGVPGDCFSTGSTTLSFKDQDGDEIVYNWVNVDGGLVARSKNGLAPIAITSPDQIEITSMQFFVRGIEDADTKQPYVMMHADVIAKSGNQRVEMTVQTGVSQRLLDLDIVQ